MRFLLFPILSISFCALAGAQEQDPGLLLQTRNEGLAGKMFQNKSFYDGKTFQGVGQANVKEFYSPQRYDATGFATKEFNAKAFSQTDVRFATKEALTKKDTRDEKAYETKAAAVKDANESGKTYGTSEYANSREFREQGKSQKVLDQQSHKKEMSSDEVRELLNKNK